jgi:hypothetical protein
MVGFALLLRMPALGVPEAVESLMDIIEFHLERPPQVLAPTADSRRGSGRVVGRTERSPFVLGE